MLFACIDLGTNTFRLLIAEIKNGNPEILLRESIIVGLGKNFDDNTNLISNKSIDNALKAIVKLSNILTNYCIYAIRVVATSVVREAYNSDLFIIPAESILNHKIDIITGNEEAELTVLGVLNSVRHLGNKLIVDIGGGSTEFIYVNSDNTIIYSQSTDLGVVKYSDKYDFSNKLTNNKLIDIYDDIKIKTNQYCKNINIKSFEEFEIIVTAGTPTTLAAIDMKLSQYDHDLVNNYRLSKRNINSILNKLIAMDCDQRLKIAGMYAGRENLIIPGAFIILCILDYYDKNKIIVSDGGLLEGLLYDIIKCKNILPN